MSSLDIRPFLYIGYLLQVFSTFYIYITSKCIYLVYKRFQIGISQIERRRSSVKILNWYIADKRRRSSVKARPRYTSNRKGFTTLFLIDDL